MQPKVELAKTRDFGEIINDTFTFIKQNFKELIKNAYLFCGVLFLAGALLTSLQQYKMMKAFEDVQQQTTPTYDSVNGTTMFGVNYFIGLFLIMLAGTLLTLSVISYMALYKQKGSIKPTSAEVWAYIKYYVGRSLLNTLVMIILLPLAFVLCIVPGFYLAPIIALILPIIVFENGSFSYAFNRSFQLIKNNWWLTAGAMFVSWIIAYFIMAAISLPASIIGMSTILFRPTTALHNMGLAAVIVTVLVQMVAMLVYIVPTVTLSLCYFNLAETKEGTSLLERINNLGNNADQQNLPAEEY
ncbi:MAG: hypothetical protein JKY70_03925 [Mucilaginibacter sp.]|nr:hypothetical protein [Mucilaginibacter sp.]